MEISTEQVLQAQFAKVGQLTPISILKRHTHQQHLTIQLITLAK